MKHIISKQDMRDLVRVPSESPELSHGLVRGVPSESPELPFCISNKYKQKHIIFKQKHIISKQKYIIPIRNISFSNRTISFPHSRMVPHDSQASVLDHPALTQKLLARSIVLDGRGGWLILHNSIR